MPFMAEGKKKTTKPTDQGRGRGRPPAVDGVSVSVSARIPPAMAAVLEEYIGGIRPKTNISAVIELALEQYLTSIGLWPPPEAKD